MEPSSYRLLDNRSATYEKMDEFRKALKDAKTMINLNKTGAKVSVVAFLLFSWLLSKTPNLTLFKGYLRAGKILQVTGKLQEALNIYTYGLAHADCADKDFKVLTHCYPEQGRRC